MTLPDTRDAPERAMVRVHPPSYIPPARRGDWPDLPADARRLLTPDVVARWAAELDDDDYTLGELARFEQRRQAALRTLRAEAGLGELEWRLLRFMQRHEGHTVTYLQIARHLWSTPSHPVTAASFRRIASLGYAAPMIGRIHNLVSLLRKKLEIDPQRPQHIAGLRGVGYRWYSQPPAVDDGEDYAQRARETERQRRQMQAVLGIVEGELVADAGGGLVLDVDGVPFETRLGPGPVHPDRARLLAPE